MSHSHAHLSLTACASVINWVLLASVGCLYTKYSIHSRRGNNSARFCRQLICQQGPHGVWCLRDFDKGHTHKYIIYLCACVCCIFVYSALRQVATTCCSVKHLLCCKRGIPIINKSFTFRSVNFLMSFPILHKCALKLLAKFVRHCNLICLWHGRAMLQLLISLHKPNCKLCSCCYSMQSVNYVCAAVYLWLP